MAPTTHSSIWIRRSFLLALCVLVGALFCSPSRGEVKFFDGFGDADLNNDGVALDFVDVDENLNDVIDSFEPAEFAGVTVFEVTTVEDANDTGIRWLHSTGWTSPQSWDPKANIKILDDSAGALPDSTHPTYPVPSLDSGLAMAYDAKGRGSSATGFFGEQVALGPEVGDQVKVSFDFRVWLSNNNMNAFTPPEGAALRFGLFQDTDNQLGMVSDFAGQPSLDDPFGIPAVWGQEGGKFDGQLVAPGAVGDHGWWTAVDLGIVGSGSPKEPDFNGTFARINEEENIDRFLQGQDNDFVAKTDEMDPTFVAMDVTKIYNLSLTLERATDATPGDTITAIVTVVDRATGDSWTLEGTEPLFKDDGMGGMIPDGISSDSWDYFAIRNTTSLQDQTTGVQGDDFDFILDNFKLEIFGSNASTTPDFNGDGVLNTADIDALVADIAAMNNTASFDLTGDGLVDQADLNQWLADAGAVNLPSGDPYLVGDANLDGSVDVSDFNFWNGNKFTSVAAWSAGDFSADGSVDVSDFNLWNGNKFNSADGHLSAVPEPGAAMLLLSAMAWGVALLRRPPRVR